MGRKPGGPPRRSHRALGAAPLSPVRALSLVGRQFLRDRHALGPSCDPAAPVCGKRAPCGDGVVGMSEFADASAFAVAPYTDRELRFHIAGAVLNGLVWVAGLIWLAAQWKDGAPRWPWIVVAIAAGVYAADLVSGLLHWAFDTWFDENI